MLIRSWMYVPDDSERKLEKALESEADALILDLDDEVADQRKEVAREMVRNYLVKLSDRSRQQLWVRINPLDNEMAPLSRIQQSWIGSQRSGPSSKW